MAIDSCYFEFAVVSGADEEQMIDQTSLEVDVSRSGCRKVVINGHLEEGQAFPSNKIR